MKARKFSVKPLTKANAARSIAAAERRARVVRAARIVANDCRKASGSLNQAKLARAVRKVVPDLGEETIRKIISKAVKSGKMV